MAQTLEQVEARRALCAEVAAELSAVQAAKQADRELSGSIMVGRGSRVSVRRRGMAGQAYSERKGVVSKVRGGIKPHAEVADRGHGVTVDNRSEPAPALEIKVRDALIKAGLIRPKLIRCGERS